MLRTLFISLLCLLGTTRALAWGQKGHDVVAYIAECNLTPEAAEKIDKILGGASMVYWANWLDSASHTPEYAYTATWHYANVDEGFTYETMTKNPDGDIVEAIDRIVAELKNGQLDPAQEQLYLKMLIHLVGDLHQPMHTGHLSDRGGNSVPYGSSVGRAISMQFGTAPCPKRPTSGAIRSGKTSSIASQKRRWPESNPAHRSTGSRRAMRSVGRYTLQHPKAAIFPTTTSLSMPR